MSFTCQWEERPNTFGLDPRVAVLGDANNHLEVWPALGFNAYRWHVAGQELLYASPTLFTEKKPTRTGVPIVFPFPNRIRDGRFDWAGKTYTLPINDPAKPKFGDRIKAKKPDVQDPYVVVSPTDLPEVARYLRDDARLRFELLNCISGVDYLEPDPKKAPRPASSRTWRSSTTCRASRTATASCSRWCYRAGRTKRRASCPRCRR